MSSSQRLQVILNHLQGPVHPFTKQTSAKKYFYTVDNNVLTEAQRDFYEENGYIVIPNLVNQQLIEECRTRFVDICNGKIDKGNMVFMKDKSLMNTGAKGEFLINKAQDIHWDDALSKYVTYEKMLDYVQCFTGPNIVVFQSMLINKPPDANTITSMHPLHQDLHYYAGRPAERVVASWTAMEKVTVDNGCLYVIPGTHKSSLQPHDYPADKKKMNIAYHGIKGFDLVPKIYVEMEKGDTVFFHPLLLHGSGPNTTKGFRKAISWHYASIECTFIDVTGTTQENVANEVKSIYAKQGIHLSFQDFLRLRQRLVRGALRKD